MSYVIWLKGMFCNSFGLGVGLYCGTAVGISPVLPIHLWNFTRILWYFTRCYEIYRFQKYTRCVPSHCSLILIILNIPNTITFMGMLIMITEGNFFRRIKYLYSTLALLSLCCKNTILVYFKLITEEKFLRIFSQTLRFYEKLKTSPNSIIFRTSIFMFLFVMSSLVANQIATHFSSIA